MNRLGAAAVEGAILGPLVGIMAYRIHVADSTTTWTDVWQTAIFGALAFVIAEAIMGQFRRGGQGTA